MVPGNVHTVSLTLLKFILRFLATLTKKRKEVIIYMGSYWKNESVLVLRRKVFS